MYMIMLLVSVAAFVIIILPPGDYMGSYIARMQSSGNAMIDLEMIDALRASYGLDRPI